MVDNASTATGVVVMTDEEDSSPCAVAIDDVIESVALVASGAPVSRSVLAVT